MDGFIDDIITITVDNTYGIERAKNAALLVIHTLFRTLQASEPLEHNNSLSLRKLVEEGKTIKLKTCIVWDINTHYLRVFIPK